MLTAILLLIAFVLFVLAAPMAAQKLFGLPRVSKKRRYKGLKQDCPPAMQVARFSAQVLPGLMVRGPPCVAS